jgi:O-acetyl-ADP-ribose deacetylase (regulator of RNase III)
MIEQGSGDLLAAEVDALVNALVNAVNAVGVMGKGLALQFKKAFPDNFRAYERACGSGQVVVGRMLVVGIRSIAGVRVSLKMLIV